MKYIYGPLQSRRLGNSLGINLTPFKICTFDCIYCQLGKTTVKTRERKEYLAPGEIIVELKTWLEHNPEDLKKLDYISLSGSGEPTLNISIDKLIKEIKEICQVPIAVITNASLFSDASVRSTLAAADLIVPSLDTVVSTAFEKIDRPEGSIKIEEIIVGLISLRKEFRGKIWLEVMLVSGINDDLRYIKKLKEVVDEINPDKIQLNSPVRSTAELNIKPPSKEKMNKIKEILGDKAEII